MKSTRTYLAVFFLLTTFGAAAFAYKEYMELIVLRTRLGGPTSGMEKQLADDEKLIKSLRNQLAALSKSRSGTEEVAQDGPADAGAGGDRNADRRAQRDAMRAIFNNPQFQALRAIQEKSQLDARYASLFKSLNLTPAQVDQFKTLMVQRQQAAGDAAQAARAAGIDPRTDPTAYQQAISDAQSDINKQLQATLGDTGYAALQTYNQTLPQRTTVSQLQTALSYGSTPLTDDQSAALIALMQQQSASSTTTANPGQNRGGGGGGGPFGGGNQGATVTAATVAAAAAILSAPQLQALQQIQQTQQAQAQMQQLFQANRPGRTNAKGG